MGMDIYGRNIGHSVGEYISINACDWPVIHKLMGELCGDLIDPVTLENLIGNDGYGIDSSDTCNVMSLRFEKWMELHPEGFTAQECDGMWKTYHPYFPFRITFQGMHPGVIDDWVGFLRHCQGFVVW